MDPAGPKRKTSALSACFPFGGGHLRSFHSLRYPDLHCSRSRVNQEWDVLTHFVGSFNHMFSQIKNQPFGWLFIWWRTWDLCRSQAICRSAPPLSVGLSRALLEAPLEPSSFRARPFGFESPQYPHKRKTSALSARFSYGGGLTDGICQPLDFNVFSICSAVFMRFSIIASPETSSFFSHCTSLKCAYQAFQSHHDASGHIRLRICPL